MEYKNNNDSNYFIKTFYFKKYNNIKFDLIENIKVDENKDYFKINKIKILINDEIEKVTRYDMLHITSTLCESRDFFDDEIYLGNNQDFVNKNICEFFLLSNCKNL